MDKHKLSTTEKAVIAHTLKHIKRAQNSKAWRKHAKNYAHGSINSLLLLSCTIQHSDSFHVLRVGTRLVNLKDKVLSEKRANLPSDKVGV